LVLTTIADPFTVRIVGGVERIDTALLCNVAIDYRPPTTPKIGPAGDENGLETSGW
jgi:hypothetical protein